MSNYIISQIRTYVPIIVGALLTLLATKYNIVVDDGIGSAGVAFLTGLLSAVYYGIIHALEQKWPQIGVLLGKASLPYYDGSTPDAAGIPVEAGPEHLAP